MPVGSGVEMSCILSAALRQACADVLGEPVQRVELIPVFDSSLAGPSTKHFHASCDNLLTPTLTLLVNEDQTYAVGVTQQCRGAIKVTRSLQTRIASFSI